LIQRESDGYPVYDISKIDDISDDDEESFCDFFERPCKSFLESYLGK
jgi:hypothetical protein